MEPLIIAAQAGIPVVDGDGMGRAFPEIQMTTFSIYGHTSTPSAMADPHGNAVIFETAVSEAFHERMARAVVVAQGGSSTLAFAPMSGAFTRRAAVPGTYTQAISLGHSVLDARAERRDPVTAICDAGEGKLAFRGKITDVQREITGGFLRGGLTIEGFDEWQGQSAGIELQNEYLMFRRDGVAEIVVPDLIVVLDADERHAAVHRYAALWPAGRGAVPAGASLAENAGGHGGRRPRSLRLRRGLSGDCGPSGAQPERAFQRMARAQNHRVLARGVR